MEERLREEVQNLSCSELPPDACLQKLASIIIIHQTGESSQPKLATQKQWWHLPI